MSADEKIVKAIAKQLPVIAAYTDAIKPAAKQLGHLGEDILKALRLALFPVTVAAGLHDRFERFVKHAVARVPEKHRWTDDGNSILDYVAAVADFAVARA